MNPPRYPAGTWRLLISPPADGATNMAIDEAILRAVSAGLIPATLRLYAWEPPCLSLGRGQPGAEVDRVACARDGAHIVRRPTGGRAILHTDELTYSVIAPLDEPRLAGDIVTSYRRLSRALLAALQHMNVNVESHRAATGEPGAEAPNPVCFEVPSHYELTTADGRKLVGSAQMRTSDVVLQHGTLPLEGDIARICRYLNEAPAPERVRARAATLESALGRRVERAEAAEALVVGFSTALNLTLNRGELTPEEQSWVAELRDGKYANEVWTWRM
jgi:lipoate-protein ligase A